MAAPAVHWTIDHERHLGGSPGFADAVLATLAATRGRDTETYDLLPNFTFNHYPMSTDSPADLPQGRLEVHRVRNESGTSYTVSQYDRTSGVTVEASIVRTAATGGATVSYRRSSVPAEDPAERSYVRTTELECPPDVVVEYELFDRLPELVERRAPFRLDRLDGAAVVHATARATDEIVVPLGEGDEPVTLVAVSPGGDVPSLWWLDRRGRVLVVATTLWTLVLTEAAR